MRGQCVRGRGNAAVRLIVTDYDSPWKTALERYFPQFMAFFFPEAHAGIDWSQGHTFLDKELQKVVRDAELGRRLADKLVRVRGRDGQDDRVLVHIEVQGQPESDFAKRMYVYNYRLFDRYDRPVVSLAVLGDSVGETLGRFGYRRWGCAVSLEFPVVCLGDYRDRWDELEQSANPFAVAVQAHLKARETRTDVTGRYQAKLHLVKSLYRRGWQRLDVQELFRFIDWVLELPGALEQRLWDEVQTSEEVQKMRYLSTIERMAIDRGFQKGLDEGKAKGLAEGKAKGLAEGKAKGLAEGRAELLARILRRRFGDLPEWVEIRLREATPEQLESWADHALDATHLEAVFD